ncbi:ankyrin repeat-containing protein [Fusarium sp. NRRL 52700]|nr:ankyrin repeat-containing protein [Fusarium sp. NRRL 52700]
MDEQHSHLGTATGAPIAEITSQCLVKFDLIDKVHDKDLAQRLINVPRSRGLQRSSFSFPGLRNHFLRWIQKSGALSVLDLSLDETLKGLNRLFSIINRMLEWILRSLNCLAQIPSSDTLPSSAKHDDRWLLWQEASMSIEGALETLHSVSHEIRRLSPQQYEDQLTTTETEAHMAFRENMIALVGRRFPAARKDVCELLGKSIAATRHMLLQAQARERSANRMSRQSTPALSQDRDTRSRARAAINRQGRRTRSAGPTSSTRVTTSSQYSPQTPILERVQGPSQTALRRVMSNFTTPQHDSSDYPPMPEVSQEQAAVHDWLREVHTKQWYCDSGHESTFTFELEAEWRQQMLDPASHPKQPETRSLLQLKALSQLKQRRVRRDMYVCLLCERIPEEVQQKLETGHQDTADLYNCIMSHIATHLKSLSLLAIPFLADVADETAKLDQDSVASTKDHTNRPVNNESLPDLQTAASDMPLGQSPDLNHEIIELNMGEGWDDDFEGYRQPNEAPESARRSWTDYLPRCKYEQDPEVMRLLGLDQVEKHLGSNETQTSTTDVDFQDDVGQTALSLAAQEDDIETMRGLIVMGANIELPDRNGKTPLCWAAAEGKERAVKFLIDHGAQIEATEHIYGRTSLSWAAARGHVDVVRVLCVEGAQVNAVDDSKRTAMSWAAARGNEETLQLLLDAGADVQSNDTEFWRTPLHWAATRNRPKNVSLLLQHGAAIEAIDGSSKTPLCLASQDGYAAVVEVLLNNGADIETLHPKYAQTPLSLASGGGYEDVVRLLLEHGAKIDAKDSQGRTARDWAIEESQDEIVKLLEAHPGDRISLPYR